MCDRSAAVPAGLPATSMRRKQCRLARSSVCGARTESQPADVAQSGVGLSGWYCLKGSSFEGFDSEKWGRHSGLACMHQPSRGTNPLLVLAAARSVGLMQHPRVPWQVACLLRGWVSRI